MSASNLVAVVDVGTSQTRVFAAQLQRGGAPASSGVGQVPAGGLSKGVIDDAKALKDSVGDALRAAESQAGVRLESVLVALSGARLPGKQQEGWVSVSGAGERVSRGDMERAEKEALRVANPEGYVRVSSHFQAFHLDKTQVSNPEGMTGRQLRKSYWVVHGRREHVGNLIQVMEGNSLKVGNLIPASVASALAVTDESMRKHGVLVVDFGAGTVDIALYCKGVLVYTHVLPLGGERISSDLAHGLRMKLEVAERLKIRGGAAFPRADDANKTLWMYGDKTIGDRQLNCATINTIIHARVRETFDFIKRRLGDHAVPEKVASGVILTGGTANLKGIGDVAHAALGLEARVAGIYPEWVQEGFAAPQYSTVLGLLLCAARHNHPAGPLRARRSSLRRWLKWFRT